MKKTIRIILVLFLVSYSALVTLADPPTPPNPGDGNGPTNDNYVGAPIDHGLVLLILFAAVLGVTNCIVSIRQRNWLPIKSLLEKLYCSAR